MLPEGWVKIKLGDLGRVKSGATPLRSEGDRYFSDSGYPWVKTMDLNNGEIINTDECITDIALKETSCSIFPKGTVLVAMYGGFNQIGRTGMLTKPSAVNQAISAIQLSEDRAHSQYVLAFLNGFVSKWKRFAASSRKDPNITRDDVVGFPILLPPLPEQKKIAQILSTWDNAISATERLLENSQQRKKALMQQLLTGKLRLPGFVGSWTEEKLGQLFHERNESGRLDLPLLSITSNNGVMYQDETGRKDTSSLDKKKYKRICIGDIGYNTMRMWQGRSSISDKEGVVSPAYTILKSTVKANSSFFAYLFKHPKIVYLFYSRSQGLVSDTWSLKYKHFKNITVSIPNLEEQQAIANVLTTADQEIDALQKRLDHLKLEKKALMQQLLTGKRRVTLN